MTKFINFDYINRLLVGSEYPTRLPCSSLLLAFRQVVKVVNYAKNRLRLRLCNRLVIDWKSIAFSIELKIWNDFYKISKELGLN